MSAGVLVRHAGRPAGWMPPEVPKVRATRLKYEWLLDAGGRPSPRSVLSLSASFPVQSGADSQARDDAGPWNG